MLEKIGLPGKPSMKGGNWVIDASHCQGCASQFTFLNRKHHCRRCGGLFCGTCTSQKMYLRGQGDSAVRICDACKKLEDAARFEMRHGSRTKQSRGSTNSDAKIDEKSLLRDILGTDSKELPSSSSNSSPSSVLLEEKSVTVESLRKQAIEEKEKHKTLKKEGKNKEALEAFKRGKELERKANSLELAERKNRRKPAPASHSPLIDDLKRGKRVSQNNDDDILTELNKLGWNEPQRKIPISSSAEDEFSLLLKETSQPRPNPLNRNEVIAMKKAAVALKKEGKLAEAKEELKKAKELEKRIEEEELLNAGEDSEDEVSAMMRELGDVKEDEVIFEESVLGENVEVTEADLIDPEMKAALASFGWTDEPEEPNSRFAVQKEEPKNPTGFPKSRLAVQKELIAAKKRVLALKREGRVEEAEEELKKCGALEKQLASEPDAPIMEDSFVKHSDADLIDPEMKSALESFGWPDEDESKKSLAVQKEEPKNPTGFPKSRLAVQKELIAAKKKVLALKREGKVAEAEEELSKCRALEKQLESGSDRLQDTPVIHPAADIIDPEMKAALESFGWTDESEKSKNLSGLPKTQLPIQKEEGKNPVGLPKSRLAIQKELIALKKKALSLRREGREEEAEEELRKCGALEKQLASESEAPRIDEDIVSDDVTDRDLTDPSYLSSLKSIGWEDEGERETKSSDTEMVKNLGSSREGKFEGAEKPEAECSKEANTRADKRAEEATSDDVASLKKKAVMLKREGKLEEAKEWLRRAKELEVQVAGKAENSGEAKAMSGRERFKLQQEVLGHKRVAMRLRREGRVDEAESEFKLAKDLEARLDETAPDKDQDGDVEVEDFLDGDLLSALKEIGFEGLTSNKKVKLDDRIATVDRKGKLDDRKLKGVSESNMGNSNKNDEISSLEEMIKEEKIKAVRLKREGNVTEALQALRNAKLLERKLNAFHS